MSVKLESNGRGNTQKCVTSYCEPAFPAVHLLSWHVCARLPLFRPWHSRNHWPWLDNSSNICLCVKNLYSCRKNRKVGKHWVRSACQMVKWNVYILYYEIRHLKKWENARKSHHTAVNRFLCWLAAAFQSWFCLSHYCLWHSSSSIEAEQYITTLCWLCAACIASMYTFRYVIVYIYMALWVRVYIFSHTTSLLSNTHMWHCHAPSDV